MQREWVEPGELRLPSSRRDGPDLMKLADQVRRFGGAVVGMPPIQVTRGSGGETRSARRCGSRVCRESEMFDMNAVQRELQQAIAELADLYPDWRYGQLISNAAAWAGASEPAEPYDVSDEELLRAIRSHLERRRAAGAASRQTV